MKLELPVMDCSGCPGDCCSAVVCTEKEFRRITRYVEENGVEPVKQGVGRCCFAQNGRCQVYDARPLLCRVFGHGKDERLTCPHGRNVNVPDRKIQRAFERQNRKEGLADRWVNEFVYSAEELEAWLPLEAEMP